MGKRIVWRKRNLKPYNAFQTRDGTIYYITDIRDQSAIIRDTNGGKEREVSYTFLLSTIMERSMKLVHFEFEPKVTVMAWSKESTPYPRKGQIIQNAFGDHYKVIKFDRVNMQVELQDFKMVSNYNPSYPGIVSHKPIDKGVSK